MIANNGKFDVFRNTIFGEPHQLIVADPADTLYEFFSAKILTDLSINDVHKSVDNHGPAQQYF